MGGMPLTEQMIKAKTKLDRLDDVRNLNLWGQGFTDVSILQYMPRSALGCCRPVPHLCHTRPSRSCIDES